MKLSLNIGCGNHYVDGWVNVDHGSPHRKDLDVDLTGELPWQPESVSRIYAGHFFEHVSQRHCSLLAARLLRCADPLGCTLVVVGPDVDVATQMIADGTFDYTHHSLESIKHGAGRWAGDVHLWETTGPKIARLIRDAGWPVVHTLSIDQLESGWPVVDRTQLWQYVIRAWTGKYT